MSAIAKTASITLITAVPGSGKSLRAVWYAKEAVEQGDQVFVCNINGIAVEGVIDFPDPTKWEELPAGSVLIVDEAQKFFRAGLTEKDTDENSPTYGKPIVPKNIQAMETIRHMGIRLLLITQHPTLIHANVRSLVGYHEHLVRENGAQTINVYTRSRVIDNVRSDKALAAEDHHKWVFPKDCFELYKSAEVHTVKRTVKSRHKRAVILLVVAGVLVGFAVWKISRQVIPQEGQAIAGATAASQPRSAGRAPTDADEPRWKDPHAYAQDHLPRFGTMPWTAPVFDGRAAVSDPLLICMSSPGGVDAQGDYSGPSCSCMTEQGTRYEISQPECRRVARHGMPYNPYRERTQQQLAYQAPTATGPSPQPYRPPVAVSGGAGTAPRPMVDPTFGTITRGAP